MTRPGKALAISAFAIGFALSGFFDGVLLHQILQWHHLLSAIEGDMRFQVAADGWYHVFMYAVAAWGLWRLWRARAELDAEGAGRHVASWGLIGFGAWHVLDALGSHWLLGIHRIRMDVTYPLAWDVGWLAMFGLVPLLIGWRLRSAHPPTGSDGRRGRTSAAILVALVASLGTIAMRAAPGPELTTIVFAPHVEPADALLRAVSSGASLVWNADGVVVVTRLPLDAALRLYAQGAVYVGGAGLPPGCFSWQA